MQTPEDSRPDQVQAPTLSSIDSSLWSATGANAVTSPLEIKNAAEQVVERILTAVALGCVLPGEKLPSERVFAERLGVSRATLRHALHQLRTEGFVTIAKGRSGGTRVQTSWETLAPNRIRTALLHNWRRLEWVMDIYRGLAQLTPRLAAERRTDEDVERLREAAKAYSAPEWHEEEANVNLNDQAIHVAIAQATHNPYLVSLWNQVWAEVSLGTQTMPYSPALREQAKHEHDHLVEAIARRDGDMAAGISLTHFVSLSEMPLRQARERILRETQPRQDGHPD